MPGEQSPLSLKDFIKDAMKNKWLLVITIDDSTQFIINEGHHKKKYQRENWCVPLLLKYLKQFQQ